MFKKLSVKTMTTAAVLIAISVVLARFCVIYLTPSVRINFGNIPIMLTGLLYGPIIGGLAGGIADLIGSLMLSAMGWYPPLTVSAVLIGFIPGLFAFIPRKKPSLIGVGTTVLIANVCASMIWSTYWLAKLTNVSVLPLAAVRVPLYIGMSVLETIVLTAVYKITAKRKGE